VMRRTISVQQPQQVMVHRHHLGGGAATPEVVTHALIPLHPQLVMLRSDHIASFPPAKDGRIFTSPRGGIFTDQSYLLIFH
jgi:hypothetical protein